MRPMGATRLTVAACLIVGSQHALAAEGDALTRILAQEVHDNTDITLPNPFDVLVNTPSDRDVGTVTEHGYKDNLEVTGGSLETTAEQNGGTPSIDIRRILVEDSGNTTWPPSCYRTGSCAGGAAVRHLNGVVNPTGATTVWGWQRHRYFALKEWMAGKADNDLVIVHASGEVLFAGCTESTIQQKYDLIIRANGGTGSIVLGAEVSPLHEDQGYAYDLRQTELDASRFAFLNDPEVAVSTNWATNLADCTTGFCNSPNPKVQFANPAFIMGPVGDIAEMLAGMPQWADTEYRLISKYYLDNPDKVALDYAGILVASLHNMKTRFLVEVEDAAGSKSFRNKVTNQAVCFVHGGGSSFTKLKVLADELLA